MIGGFARINYLFVHGGGCEFCTQANLDCLCGCSACSEFVFGVQWSVRKRTRCRAGRSSSFFPKHSGFQGEVGVDAVVALVAIDKRPVGN